MCVYIYIYMKFTVEIFHMRTYMNTINFSLALPLFKILKINKDRAVP